MEGELLIKMSHIGVINLLEVKIGIEASPFEYLEKMSIEELEVLRDKLVPRYNKVIEDRKFTAEMIYDRKPKDQSQFAKELTNLAKDKMYFTNKNDWQEKFWKNNYHIWLTAQGIQFCVNADHEQDALDFVMDYCVEKQLSGLYTKKRTEEEYVTAENFGYQFTTHNIRIELID